jgi:hypothetical protein
VQKIYAKCQKFNDSGSVIFIAGILSTEIFTVIVEVDVLYTGISEYMGENYQLGGVITGETTKY